MPAALCYLAGVLLGGALLGTALALAGAALAWLVGARPALPAWALAAACLCGAARDAGLLPLPLPQWRQQVNRWWLTVFGANAAFLAWGLLIGLGVHTRYFYTIPYIVALWILSTGSAPAAVLLLGSFGLTYGGCLVVLTVLRGAHRVQSAASALPPMVAVAPWLSAGGLLAAALLLAREG